MGIYEIENTANGKIYVGSSVNVEARLYEHYRTLKNGTHRNIHLQRSWDKYSESSFTYKILECVLCEDALLSREQFWMDKTRAYNSSFGYNICKIAGRTTGVKKSAEEIAKMKERAKRNASSPDFHLRKYMFEPGHKLPEEVRRKIGEKSAINFAGEKSPLAKLTNNDVRQIIPRILRGDSDGEIASDYNVTRKTINHIRYRRTFKGVINELVPGAGCLRESTRNSTRGESNPSAKLSNDQVREIKILLKGTKTIAEIAREFEVSWSTIKLIKEGKKWQYLAEEDK